MTQNKSVEEVVEEFWKRYGNPDSFSSRGQFHPDIEGQLARVINEYITEIIQQERQTSQEREREIVEVIENMTVENANINFKVNENVLDFANSLLTEFKRKALRTLTNPNKD